MATIELTEENFEETITGNAMVLVDFWASWCGPCQQFAPTYEAASERHEDIVFGSINTEEQHGLAAAAEITSIPTLMVFKEGNLVFSQPGALPPAGLEQLVQAVRDLDLDQVHREQAAEG